MTIPRTILALAAMLAVSTPVGAGAQGDTQSKRDDVRERQQQVETQIDVLQASDAEINNVLDGLDADIAAQQSVLDDAQVARAAAEADLDGARAGLDAARHDVEALQHAIQAMAVASYIHPPTADFVLTLEADSFSDALLQRSYLDARARRDVNLLDLLEQAERTAADREAAVEVAAADAARAVDAAGAALDELRQEQARQRSFGDRLQERIDAALAESAVLADMDAQLSDQLAAEQAALIARIPPQPVETVQAVSRPVTAQLPVPTSTTSPPTTESTSDSGGSTSTTSTTSTTRPPSTSGGSTPSLRTVQGITVNADIADDVDALLTAAAADGIALSGWGYRSSDSQIALREAHCGSTEYGIWEKPASACSPPTAIPGRSMHEQGRAIDLTYQGRTITSRSSPAYLWLDDHASSYGLFNLPSEPWHWSTNGS